MFLEFWFMRRCKSREMLKVTAAFMVVPSESMVYIYAPVTLTLISLTCHPYASDLFIFNPLTLLSLSS